MLTRIQKRIDFPAKIYFQFASLDEPINSSHFGADRKFPGWAIFSSYSVDGRILGVELVWLGRRLIFWCSWYSCFCLFTGLTSNVEWRCLQAWQLVYFCSYLTCCNATPCLLIYLLSVLLMGEFSVRVGLGVVGQEKSRFGWLFFFFSKAWQLVFLCSYLTRYLYKTPNTWQRHDK